MRIYASTLLASLFAAICLGVCWHNLIISRRENGCEMTYSWPVYTQLNMGKKEHHKYNLFALHMEQFRPVLNGIPVLYIPGHLGSYKQARSFASHGLEFSETKDKKEKFDFFIVDFGEELSGLSGMLVKDQSKFVNDAIQTILNLYTNPRKFSTKHKNPTSVLIIAHSMGGIVARSSFIQENFVPNSIEIIFSLSTPYVKPPYPFDTAMKHLYYQTNSFWQKQIHLQQKLMSKNEEVNNVTKTCIVEPPASFNDSSRIQNATIVNNDTTKPFGANFTCRERNDSVTEEVDLLLNKTIVISIAGGYSDLMIHSSLTNLDNLAHSSRSLSILTSNLPGVTFPIDHLCLVWCYQLLHSVTKSMIAIVDDDVTTTANELIKDPIERLARIKQSFKIQHISSVELQKSLARGYHSQERPAAQLWQLVEQSIVDSLREHFTKFIPILYSLLLQIFAVQLYYWQGRNHPRSFAFELSRSFQKPTSFLPLSYFIHNPLFVPRLICDQIWLIALSSEYLRQILVLLRSKKNYFYLSILCAVLLLVLVYSFMVAYSHHVQYFSPYFILSSLVTPILGYLFFVGLFIILYYLFSIVNLLIILPMRFLWEKLSKWGIGKYSSSTNFSFIIVPVIVFACGHFDILSKSTRPWIASREIALAFLSLLTMFYYVLFRMLVFSSRKIVGHIYMKYTIFVLFFFPPIPVWVGHVVYSLSTVNHASAESITISNWYFYEGLVFYFICLMLLILLPIYMVSLCESWMLPLPPISSLMVLDGFEQAMNSLFVLEKLDQQRLLLPENEKHRKADPGRIPVSDCTECRYEDGGKYAIYEEIEQPGSQYGSIFRVVSCNCAKEHRGKVDKYCDFCSRECMYCGGSEVSSQKINQWQNYLYSLDEETVIHQCVPHSVVFLSLYMLFVGVYNEHQVIYVVVFLALLIIFYHKSFRSKLDEDWVIYGEQKFNQKREQPLIRELYSTSTS